MTPGVYSFASSAQLTGPLTLDFQGLNDANIVFQIGSTLMTASGSVIDIINQGLADNVFFQVGSSATLETYSTFQGDILANTSVTLTTGANGPGPPSPRWKREDPAKERFGARGLSRRVPGAGPLQTAATQ